MKTNLDHNFPHSVSFWLLINDALHDSKDDWLTRKIAYIQFAQHLMMDKTKETENTKSKVTCQQVINQLHRLVTHAKYAVQDIH